MRRWLSLLLIAVPLVAGAVSPADARRSDDRPPNLVLILADDAGYADFGFQENPIWDLAPLTPNIDTIAAEGVRLTGFYMSASVCSPSRAGMLTGRYQQRFGHETNIPPGYMKGGLSLDERTLADHLKAAGYVTACVGKWHLGYPGPFQPNARGFDAFFGCLQGSRTYFPYEDPTPHRVLLENKKPTPEEGYVTDRLGDAAVRFVREHSQEPFFLYLSFTAPHGPLQPRPEDIEHPDLIRIQKDKRRKYAGLVKALDENVGKLLTALREEGLAENTLVLFTNDNGGQTQTGANNGALRGKKGTLYEGGVRVPCAVRWPGVLPAGISLDEPMSALDLVPTFLSAAGAAPVVGPELDGIDLLPRWKGEVASLSERTLFWRSSGQYGPIAMRRGKWKLVWEERKKAPQLYDLEADPSEKHDLQSEKPYVARELQDALDDWEVQLTKPLWGMEKKRTR